MPTVPLPPRNPDGSYTTPPAGMEIDGDGANGQTGGVPVYAPPGFRPAPLDFLANAGGPGNWFGVITDNNESDGRPVKQKKGDPAPGAYVSATSYCWPKRARTNPLAYVDAASVPYIVLPAPWRRLAVGVVLGCKATVTDLKTGKILRAAGVFDFGPRRSSGRRPSHARSSSGFPPARRTAARARSDSSTRFSPASRQ